MPSPADQDEIPARVEAAVAAEGLGPCESSPLDQMVCLRLCGSGVLALAEQDRRTALVEEVEALGFRYVALDLNPLDSTD